LVAAAGLLEHPSAQVLLVGDGPERKALERESKRISIADRVHFVGFVAHDRLPGVLAHADVLVLPSLYEELGTVLLEAMQAGLPIVASKTGGIPDVIEDGVNGLLVPPGNPGALARAIDRLLADRVDAVARVELSDGRGQVVAHGSVGQEQVLGDRLRVQALGVALQHLDLAWAERVPLER
jgi:glycosyltransferase involved in cell wall biosynthesis